MSKRGDELIESAKQALAWARGEDVPGMVVHEPKPAINVRAVRRKTGLSQDKFAERFGIPVATLRGWERGYRTPQGATRVLLLVIDREPEAVLRALEDAA